MGKNFKFKPILHWFTGGLSELKAAVENGYYFSVNGSMLKSRRFLDMLPMIPSTRILLETDSPFTYYNGSHSNTLSGIAQELKTIKPDLDLWQNFNDLLK